MDQKKSATSHLHIQGFDTPEANVRSQHETQNLDIGFMFDVISCGSFNLLSEMFAFHVIKLHQPQHVKGKL